MDIEPLLRAIYFALRWRVLACLGISLFAASKLAALPWVSVLQLIVFVSLGVALGLAWEESWDPSKKSSIKTPPHELTAPTTAVAAALIGFGAWGAVSSTELGSVLFGAGVAATALACWCVVHTKRRGSMQAPMLLVFVAASAVGYVVGIVVARYVG